MFWKALPERTRHCWSTNELWPLTEWKMEKLWNIIIERECNFLSCSSTEYCRSHCPNCMRNTSGSSETLARPVTSNWKRFLASDWPTLSVVLPSSTLSKYPSLCFNGVQKMRQSTFTSILSLLVVILYVHRHQGETVANNSNLLEVNCFDIYPLSKISNKCSARRSFRIRHWNTHFFICRAYDVVHKKLQALTRPLLCVYFIFILFYYFFLDFI